MTCWSSWYRTSPRQFGHARMSRSCWSIIVSFLLVPRIGRLESRAPNETQNLRRLLLQELARPGLHVQPEQGLRVRGPHVEPPVVVLHGQAVQAVLPSVREPPRQLLDLPVLVGDLGVDLAGVEIPPERRQQLRKGPAGPGHLLEHDHARD